MAGFKHWMLSPKLALVWGFHYPEDAPFHAHWCPACETLHEFAVLQPFKSNNAKWSFDGNAVAPTFNPSMNIRVGPFPDDHMEICHYFLHGGRIQFLGDCTHAMAGQTVDLSDIPAKRFLAMPRAF